MVRYKPPLPAIEGLYGKPTVVNNVISLATIPIIMIRADLIMRISVWGAQKELYQFNWLEI